MIGLQYTLENLNGDSIIINDHTTNPNQIIALQAYPQFDVDIKNAEINREGQHGIWDFFSFYGRRLTTFSGVIVGATEEDVETVKNQLIKVLALPSQPNNSQSGYVTLSWTDTLGDNWYLRGKLVNTIQFNRNMKQIFRLDFNFSIKSADPFILSQEIQEEDGIRGYTQVGALFPLSLPAILGSTQVNSFIVNNEGLAFSQTIIRIYGEDTQDLTNPKITNLTTNQFFQINTTLSGSTSYIEIDSQLGTVVDNNGTDLSGFVSGDSNFLQLQQGENEMFYSSDEDPNVTLLEPSAIIEISWRNTKI